MWARLASRSIIRSDGGSQGKPSSGSASTTCRTYSSLPLQPLAGEEEASDKEREVVSWLENCSHDEAVRVLQRIAAVRPVQFSNAAMDLRALPDSEDEETGWRFPDSPVSGRAARGHGQESLRMSDFVTPGRRSVIEEKLAEQPEELPLVQFSASYYYSNENDMHIDVDVLRIGPTDGTSVVCFATRDLTALAGRTYHAESGRLVFTPGEVEKVVRIRLIDNEQWDPTLEFYVELLQDGVEGAVLGRHFHKAIVKVVDDDAFPTNRYKARLIPTSREKVEAMPMWGLLFEYCRMNLLDPDIRCGSIKLLLVDLIRNLYLVLKLLISGYVIDRVLNGRLSLTHNVPLIHSRQVALAFAVLAMVLPLTLLHALDVRKYSWKVNGLCRGMLQKALLRKFLSLDLESREEMGPVALNMAVMVDAPGLAEGGYMNMIKLASTVGQLTLIMVYQLVVPPILGKSIKQTAVVPSLFCAVLMVLFLALRKQRTTSALEETYWEEVKLSDHVRLASDTFRLISDYNKQSFFMERFQHQVSEYGQSLIETCQVQENNTYFAPWVTTLACASYTFFEGTQVIKGQVPLGLFLMDLAIIVQFGNELGGVYEILSALQCTFPTLKRLTHFLNLEVDIIRRMHLDRLTRLRSLELRRCLLEQGKPGVVFDQLPIQLGNIRFAYKHSPRWHGAVDASVNALVEIPQGKLVSFVGRRGEGKSTLLKLLGRVILPRVTPDSALVLFLPAHLRVLHVSQEPLFFRGSLYDNLVFGVAKDQAEGRLARVLTICKRLGLTKDLLQVVSSGHSDATWSKVLSLSSLYLLHIARALISNFEVLCIHKPTLAFDEITSRNIMELLREFVRQRGVEMDMATMHLRRPRTCLFTSSKAFGVEMADLVYHVSRDEGIQPLSKDAFSLEMLG